MTSEESRRLPREPTPPILPREFAEPLQRVGNELAPIGTAVVWHQETRSTNADASVLAEAGAAEGCVVIADMQTAGRGRMGRSWSSPAGAGIYASVLFRPTPEVARLLTIAAGVAIAEAIEAVAGISPVLKWPNDVYLGAGLTRKVAGILAEAGFTAGESWVVVGFGINVLPAALPHELSAHATSIESELGRSVDRGELLAACLVRLAARYRELQAGRGADVAAAWRDRAAVTFGRPVEWDDAGAVNSGVVRGIDDQGALIVATPSGVTRVLSGELRWV